MAKVNTQSYLVKNMFTLVSADANDWIKNSKRSRMEAKKAISIKMFMMMLEDAEKKRSLPVSDEVKHMWVVFVAYIVMGNATTLRGNDNFILDTDGLNRHWHRNDLKQFIITLLRKIKGKDNDRALKIPCLNGIC